MRKKQYERRARALSVAILFGLLLCGGNRNDAVAENGKRLGTDIVDRLVNADPFDGRGRDTRPAGRKSHSFVPIHDADKIEMKLVDEVRADATSHNFQSDGTTAVRELAKGKTFRVTRPPKPKDYTVNRMLKKKGKHKGKTYSVKDYLPYLTPWFSYDLKTDGPGVYYLEVETINDAPRHTVVVPVYDCPPHWFGNRLALCGFGVYGGYEVPVDGEVYTMGTILYPTRPSDVDRITVYVLSSGDVLTKEHLARYHEPPENSGAALSAVRLYKITDDLGQRPNPISYPQGRKRRLGLFIPNTNLWHREFGWTGARYSTSDGWGFRRDYFERAATDAADYFRFMGMNDMQILTTGDESPTRYTGFPRRKNTENHAVPFQILARTFAEHDLFLTPVMSKPAGHQGAISAFKEFGLTENLLLRHVSGSPSKQRRARINPMLPKYQDFVADFVQQMAEFFQPYDSVDTIAAMGYWIRQTGFGDDRRLGATYWGYDDDTLVLFQKDTGTEIPEKLFRKRRVDLRTWLQKNAWDEWLNWRAERIKRLHLRMRDAVQDVDERYTFMASGHSTFRKNPMRSWYYAAERKDPRELLLGRGYKVESYRNEENLVVQNIYDISVDRSKTHLHPYSYGCRIWNFDPRLDDNAFRTQEGNSVIIAYGKGEVPNSPSQAVEKIKGIPGKTASPPGRMYLHAALHAFRTTNPYRLHFYNWTLGHRGREFMVREFARAFMSLPAAEMNVVEGSNEKQFEHKWTATCGDRVVLVNDSAAWVRRALDRRLLESSAYREVVSGKRYQRNALASSSIHMRPFDIRVFVPLQR